MSAVVEVKGSAEVRPDLSAIDAEGRGLDLGALSRRQVIVGEAYFLRALNYLNLVRYWGAVPLRLAPAEGLASLSAPRASVDEVYAAIVADLQTAEAALPDGAANGRPSRWAATALLADLHLGRESWAQAAAKAKEVIDSGQFSLLEVSSAEDFHQIFGADVDKSVEEIFDIMQGIK